MFSMKFWRITTTLSILVFVATLLTLAYSIFNVKKNTAEEVVVEKEIPVIKITLKDDISLDEIRAGTKEDKYEGNNAEIISNGKTATFSDVQIKGRGNSTWGQPKLPFQIKFKEKVDLFGMGERKKYILLANYFDYSSLRNDLMFKLTEMIGEKYRVQGDFVELYINDDYQGLYYFTTKAEIGESAVDLRDDLGVLMELDTLHRATEDCYYSGFAECITVKEAVFEEDEEILEIAVGGFMEEFNRLEQAAKNQDFEAVSEIIDLESFAGYYLISEFANNPDAYVSSFNFYKDGPADKIHAGPLWDYDLAFSNRDWTWGATDDFFLPKRFAVQKQQAVYENNETFGKLMYYLADIPEFQLEVRKIWQTKFSGKKDDLEKYLARQIERIEPVALQDEAKWREEPKFTEEVEYLKDWIGQRYDYFETIYKDIATQ